MRLLRCQVICLFVLINAWCAEDTFDVETPVVRSFALNWSGFLRPASVPEPLTDCWVKYCADEDYDTVRLEKEKLFCTICVNTRDVLSIDKGPILSVMSGCSACHSRSQGFVDVDTSQAPAELLLRSPQRRCLWPGERVDGFHLGGVKASPNICYEYNIERKKMTVRQIVCDYTSGEQFCVEAAVHYTNLFVVGVSWLSRPCDGAVRARGFAKFKFHGHHCEEVKDTED